MVLSVSCKTRALGTVDSLPIASPLPTSSVTRGQSVTFVYKSDSPDVTATFGESCTPAKPPSCAGTVVEQEICEQTKVPDNAPDWKACKIDLPFDLALGFYEVRLYPSDKAPIPGSVLDKSPFIAIQIIEEIRKLSHQHFRA